MQILKALFIGVLAVSIGVVAPAVVLAHQNGHHYHQHHHEKDGDDDCVEVEDSGPSFDLFSLFDGPKDENKDNEDECTPPRVNVAPVANDLSLVTDENVATSSVATATDTDGPNALVFATSSNPTFGVLTGVFPVFTYTPNNNATGTDSFTFTAGDGLATSTGTVTIKVNEVVPPTCSEDCPVVNVPPTVPDIFLFTNQDTATSSIFVGTDTDGPSTLVFATSSNPAHGTVSGTFPNFTYTPNTGYFGVDSFFFTAFDGLATTTATTTITVDEAVVVPETPPVIGGGGGGGGGSSGGNGPIVGSIGGFGGSSGPTSCSPLLTKYLRIGKPNDSSQVTKLENFLNQNLGSSIKVDGIFGVDDEALVKQFQQKYHADILDPWKETKPTGIVYLTTRNKVNKLYCATFSDPIPQLIPWLKAWIYPLQHLNEIN